METTAATITEIVSELTARSDPARATQERRYLKSELRHLGVRVPAIRAVARNHLRRHPQLTPPDVLTFAEALWAHPVHELRMCSTELLRLVAADMAPGDLDRVERLLRESRTWALVDNLAVHVAGPVAERHPATGAVLDRWATDDDFWLRRSALLALLLPLRAGGGDFERFSRYADSMLEEREFFLRKAIGWVLRETAKRRPELVFRWLLPRAGRASGLTLREAMKPLSEALRERLLAAQKQPLRSSPVLCCSTGHGPRRPRIR